MSIIHMSPARAGETMQTRKRPIDRLVRLFTENLRERRRRQTLKGLRGLDDGMLDDLGLSRNEVSVADRPRLPVDVMVWMGRSR